MNETEETTEDEREIAAALEAEQELNLAEQQLTEVAESGQRYGHPSYLKYSFLFTIAFIVDVVDTTDITVVAILLSKTVSIVGTGIIYFTLWLTNGKVKRANEYEKNLATAVAFAQERVAQYSRVAMRTSRVVGKVPGMKGLARRIPRAMVRVRRIARKNPLTKVLIGGAINLVPFLAILNLMVVWIFFSYLDEKKALKGVKEASKEATEQFEIPQEA